MTNHETQLDYLGKVTDNFINWMLSKPANYRNVVDGITSMFCHANICNRPSEALHSTLSLLLP